MCLQGRRLDGKSRCGDGHREGLCFQRVVGGDGWMCSGYREEDLDVKSRCEDRRGEVLCFQRVVLDGLGVFTRRTARGQE